MSNLNVPVDAFGVPVSGQLLGDDAVLVIDDVHTPPEPKSVTTKKSSILFICAGVFFAFALVATIVVVIQRNVKASPVVGAPVGQSRALPESEVALIRSELIAVRSALGNMEAAFAQSRSQIDEMRKAGDLTALERRLLAVESDLLSSRTSLQGFAKKVADLQPLDEELRRKINARSDGRILSIGSGLARIIDNSGTESALRRGDTWKGLRVVEVRADLREVVLSDGSVLRDGGTSR